MNLKKLALLCLGLSCSLNIQAEQSTPDFWKNATTYFLLTDRFNNGDKGNDFSYNRYKKSGVLRGFEGGDIKGVIEKIEEGYFTDLGVSVLWMTPVIEQVHGYDESEGFTYSYHGYWPKDWTGVDANYGTEADVKQLIETAHKHDIKVLIDVILNHTGPTTKTDWEWPSDWVRKQPLCDWNSFEQNTKCALAVSLNDIKTEENTAVELPKELLAKWKKEGRLKQELTELNEFFDRTNYPRAAKYYLIKWLTDWVKEYGVDGYRVDTAKHIEPEIWGELRTEADYSLNLWKQNNPKLVKDDLPFYMVGEVFNWGLDGFSSAVKGSRDFDFGDKKVDFFNYGFDALINMGFVQHVSADAETIYSNYSNILNNAEMKGKAVLNYIGSHDDHNSYDRKRENTYENAFKLMMAPGGVQIYYGDEIARPMYAEGAVADANMRTFMNWEDLNKPNTQKLLSHWQKLGQFRKNHYAVGAGVHKQLNKSPYIFKRDLAGKDQVLVAKGLNVGQKSLSVYGVFDNGDTVYDYYSNQSVVVKKGKIALSSDFEYLLLGKRKE